MAVQIKPLTKKQLAEYFSAYREKFAEWDVESDVVLVRAVGPIKQRIAFEALRSGAYRPSCSITVTGPPDGAQVLIRFLDIKHREVLPREHAVKCPLVLKAMEEQFQPGVRDSLNAAEVLRLAEEEVVRDRIENVNHSCALATLNAYVGNNDRALWWCDRLESQLASTGRTPADWELRKRDFTRHLRNAVQRGETHAFLQTP